ADRTLERGRGLRRIPHGFDQHAPSHHRRADRRRRHHRWAVLGSMPKTVFIAGASGCVGLPLCKLLVADGWSVTGGTRTESTAALLKSLGVTPAVADVYDAAALTKAVVAAKPEVVIHQLTDLPDALDPAQMPAAREKNARIREVGTANLVAAAKAAGAK